MRKKIPMQMLRKKMLRKKGKKWNEEVIVIQ